MRGVRLTAIAAFPDNDRKTRFCKTTPCIKKSSLFYKHLTLFTSGLSETVRERSERVPEA